MKHDTEDVCVIDRIKGPLLVCARRDAPSVRLALLRGESLVYVTYTRTTERDAASRPIYRDDE